ncbi:DUF2326 domain-containing protein [Dyadobacter sp. BHUBP1]|uniref:DUF2326 domain-containing protein n=1 Tax=Dyadobacter sp. BHUBP1 TaxID=3424178 RepID=UPI003D3466FF
MKIAISNIEKSLAISPDITKEQIIKLYQEANIQLGDQVVKKLSDLENFNKQLIGNRVQRLTEEKFRFQEELEKTNSKIADLGKHEDEKLQYLNSTGALDDYSNLNQLLTDAEKKLHGLNQYRKLLTDYKFAQEEVKKDFADENIKTDLYLEDARELIRNNIILFKSFVEKFYSEKFSGITITNNEGKNSVRYDIKAKIQDDAGNAVSEVKIFCYDWTILKGRHNHRMKLLFHDSKITADMDTRQVRAMLDIAHKECAASDFQYIISLNQNTIDSLQHEMLGEEHQKLILDKIILNLNDKSPKEKLLGIQVDLEYDS